MFGHTFRIHALLRNLVVPSGPGLHAGGVARGAVSRQQFRSHRGANPTGFAAGCHRTHHRNTTVRERGWRIVVDNRPGALQANAMAEVLKQPADGLAIFPMSLGATPNPQPLLPNGAFGWSATSLRS